MTTERQHMLTFPLARGSRQAPDKSARCKSTPGPPSTAHEMSPDRAADPSNRGRVALFDRVTRAGLCAPFRRSGHLAEFVERGCDPELGIRVESEFVVTSPEVLQEGVAADHDARGSVPLQSAHRPEPRLEPAVVTLDPVVRVQCGVVERGRDEFFDRPLQRGSEVGHNLRRLTVWADHAAPERRRLEVVDRTASGSFAVMGPDRPEPPRRRNRRPSDSPGSAPAASAADSHSPLSSPAGRGCVR
jgi:hypothetical protein